ncbi:MAG: metallophosphoesterase family protein [Patescibacteria group bacterium]|nr:metallophosphoesterase family protein [Patescibacteria group bacterium]
MKKIGIIADIHGNYEALKAVLAELAKLMVSEIYCLGDVVGYYSQVNECCDELRTRRIPCLMGNHDWYLVGGSFCPRSKSVNDCLAYQRKVITPENLDWVKTFAIQMQIGDIHMVHGGWADPIDEYLQPSEEYVSHFNGKASAASITFTQNLITEEYFSQLVGTLFASGHTHIQTLKNFGAKTYCNPGAVGQPRDNDPRAAFATFDNGTFTLHRVKYDTEKVFTLMDKAGFNDYYYGCLKTGARNLCRLPGGKGEDNV